MTQRVWVVMEHTIDPDNENIDEHSVCCMGVFTDEDKARAAALSLMEQASMGEPDLSTGFGFWVEGHELT